MMIRIAKTEPHKTAVQAFMKEHAERTFGCAPPRSCGTLIGVWKGDTVVGSLALDFRENNSPFPLESLYPSSAFAFLFPGGFVRAEGLQAGRWFSALPGSDVSRQLLDAMRRIAQHKGKRWAVGEGKPYATKRFAELGYTCDTADYFLPNIQIVPRDGRKYYELPPPPVLFRLYL